MEETEYLVRVRHVPDPYIPRRIVKSTPQANQNIHNHQDWKGWVGRYDCKCNHMASRGNYCDSSSAESLMN